jgi:hypothetical protein
MGNDAQAQDAIRKDVVGGSVSAEEKALIDRTRQVAGYARMSHFVRDVMLAVSTSEPARTAVLAVVGKTERRAARNKSCINPAHLEAVTPVQNMRRGAHVKLSLEIVLEMRRLRGEGATYAALGRQFGVTDRCASFACRGRGSWYQETGVAA